MLLAEGKRRNALCRMKDLLANKKQNRYFNRAFVNTAAVPNQTSMKTASTRLPFGTPPLQVVQAAPVLPKLSVVKAESLLKKGIVPKTSQMVDDPLNWDEDWFGNYE